MTCHPHHIQEAHDKGTTQLRVSLIAVWLTKFGEVFQGNAKLMALHNLIAKPLVECMNDCGAGQHQHKTQSAAVHRRAVVEIKAMELVRIDELGGTPGGLDAWAAWWLALDGVAQDAMALWGKAPCWRWLAEGTELLAMTLHEMAGNPARSETVGTRIYLRGMEATQWV